MVQTAFKGIVHPNIFNYVIIYSP